jgi:AcrR family transcriptional regulator
MSETIAIRKGVNTRQVFMDAGRRVFVRDGYLNAEIGEIAREAGKSNGTFYIYFENKPALLEAMIEELRALIDEKFREHDELWYVASTAGDWESIVINMWRSFKLNAPTFHALSQASLVDKHFADAYLAIRARTRIDFVNFLKARQKLGFWQGANIQFAAVALENMILAVMREWLMEGGAGLDRREEKKAIATLTAIFSAAMAVE